MESTNINIRTDLNVKNQAEKIYESLGLNMSTAINMFLRQTIITNGIPFPVRLNVPNEITAAAIEEGQRIAKDNNYKGYKTISELKDAFDEI